MKALDKQGIKVARRTVAKYREQLGILPSHLRKTF
jgi:RNA polymerase sigma-54 factor